MVSIWCLYGVYIHPILILIIGGHLSFLVPARQASFAPACIPKAGEPQNWLPTGSGGGSPRLLSIIRIHGYFSPVSKYRVPYTFGQVPLGVAICQEDWRGLAQTPALAPGASVGG